MDYKLEELLDIPLLQNLQERLNTVYPFPSSIVNNDGKVLTAVAWQDICTKFHRVNTQSEKECIKSSQYIKEHISEANPSLSYKCPHGLIDCATPIIIDGKHLGNFLTGQFLMEEPDIAFFRKQAKNFEYDEEEYLKALSKVPVWSKEKLENYIDFIKGFVEIVAGFGTNKLREIELNRVLKEKEYRYQTIIDTSSDGFCIADKTGKVMEVNDMYSAMCGFSKSELLSMNISDLEANESEMEIQNHIHEIIEKGNVRFESKHRKKDGSVFDVELSIHYDTLKGGQFVAFVRDISERKKAESTFHDIIEKNPMSIQIVDLEGCSLKTNSAHTALFGAVPPPDFSIFKDLEQKGLGEYIVLAKSGKEARFPDLCYNVHDISPDYPDNPTWIRSLIFPLKDSEGNTERYVIMHENVNEAKKAEQRLEKQLLYTTALNQIAEVINSFDKPDDILSNANRIVGETLKADRSIIFDIAFDRNEINGLCEWLRYEHPDIEHTSGKYPLEMFLSPFTQIRKSKTYLTSHSNNINEYYSKDGSGNILHESFKIKSLIWYPLAFDEHGFYSFSLSQILTHREWTKEEIDFLESVTKHISLALMKIRLLNERKQAEDALKHNHNLLLKLSNQVPGVIYQYRLYEDGSSCFPYSSNGMNEIYEYSPEGLIEDATPVFGRLHPEDVETVSQLIFESARTLKLFECEFRVVLPRQGLRWRYSSAVPERMEDGSTLWHGIIYDITDRKQTELELIKAKEKAEESDRLKSAFLANMSHEIRTPMNGILGFAELLKEPKLTGEEQRKYVSVIERSGARMLNVINNIVDIAKIESGQMKISIIKTNINKQVDYLCTFFKPEAQSKGIILNCSNALPDAEATINTDREKIYAILTNIIKNAVKYTDEGTIEFGYKKKGKFLEFFVKDTGTGIAADRQEAIFERFVQADLSDSRAMQGTGLGLTITKAYVEMLGGKIWVESELGKGTAFYFTIPYLVNPDEHISINLNRTNDEKSGIKNLKILIAEDDEACEMLLRRNLGKFCKNITSVINGADAVAEIRNKPDIDLIMMDIKMPVMDGYEATREIRKFNKDVIIIAQTAFALAGDMEKSINVGCNDYITKPINNSKLNELIVKYFGGDHRK